MTRAELGRYLRQAAGRAFDAAFELGWEFGISQRRNSGEERALYDAMYSARDSARSRFLDKR